MAFKYGKTPARPGAMKLALSDYLDTSKLPTIPKDFGHDAIVADYGMLGNADFGCCVWAGAAHETMIWNTLAGRKVAFTDRDVLEDYAAVTGFDPRNPATDNGTDMVLAAQYRQKTGVRDALGNRHTIAAYVSVDVKKPGEVVAAAYLFGAIGIGVQMPNSAQDQFERNYPWYVVPGATIEGGHYVPLVGHRNGMYHVVTWGKVQQVTPGFLNAYCDEAIAYCSMESLVNNKSPEGFDAAALLADLHKLG